MIITVPPTIGLMMFNHKPIQSIHRMGSFYAHDLNDSVSVTVVGGEVCIAIQEPAIDVLETFAELTDSKRACL